MIKVINSVFFYFAAPWAPHVMISDAWNFSHPVELSQSFGLFWSDA